MAHILPATWNVNFAQVGDKEKNKMQEELDELGALIYSCDWVMMRC